MNYYTKQIERAEEKHDKTYAMKIKFYGTVNHSNFMSVTPKQLKAIKKTLNRNG